MTKTDFDGSDSEVRLPTRQQIIDSMLAGTTIWWELVGEDWVCYYIDCKDVHDHVFLIDGTNCLVKIYNRVLPYEEKQAIFEHESQLFAPQENGRLVELKEWGLH